MQDNKSWGDHIKMGEYEFSSRVVMAALTRTRCNPQDGIPTDLVIQYYEQRSGAAFILTEASAWSPKGHAFPGAGNFYTKEQAEGWRKVIEAVHEKNGKIFLQIFHSGRSTHPKLNGGLQILSASPLAIRQTIPFLNEPYPVPKEMTLEDIKETQEQFRKSIIMAKEVGFDGVQLHGAHGYLIDQFLRSQTNKRTDNYGGSIENRCRFALQLVDIALQHFKPYQVGIKISPICQYNDMFDQNPVETFSHLLQELDKRNIGFVEIRESDYDPNKKGSGAKLYYDKTPTEQIEIVCRALRPFFKGVIIANEAFTPDKGLEFFKNGWADMVSFGRLYISNPDLNERILKNQQLNRQSDWTTYFSPLNPKGYVDYPFYEQWIQQKNQQAQ